MPEQPKASCIAIIGPAHAGKTTLLHQLDEKLKSRLDSVLVIKGSPDGTGRYLYHSPDLRNDPDFKRSVKGAWGAGTIDRICEWITHGRSNLSLALLDFGGRHDDQTAAGNAQMLRCCSHYLVVSRDTDPVGAAFWDKVARSHGLKKIAWMRSLPKGSAAPAVTNSGPVVEATFQIDIEPSDPVNDPSLEPLADILVALSCPPNLTAYVNLHRPGDWRVEHISDAGGNQPKIAELALRTGVVVLGGAAPLWAYLAGLKCALDARPDARVFFFDPRQPERLVEIPVAPGRGPSDFPDESLRVSWRQEGDRSVLQFEITTPDKFLSPTAAQNLAGAPYPPRAPSAEVALSGAGPTWLYGVYARWLISAGAVRLASWDGRMRGFVQIW